MIASNEALLPQMGQLADWLPGMMEDPRDSTLPYHGGPSLHWVSLLVAPTLWRPNCTKPFR